MNSFKIVVRFRDDCKDGILRDFQLNPYTHIADIHDNEISLIIGTDDLRAITDMINYIERMEGVIGVYPVFEDVNEREQG